MLRRGWWIEGAVIKYRRLAGGRHSKEILNRLLKNYLRCHRGVKNRLKMLIYLM
jgi:hypothetical protein